MFQILCAMISSPGLVQNYEHLSCQVLDVAEFLQEMLVGKKKGVGEALSNQV